MVIDVTTVIRRPPIEAVLSIALKVFAKEYDLESNLDEEDMKLLEKYDLTTLTDIDEFKKSFFRSLYSRLQSLNPRKINGGIEAIICYTLVLSLDKDPDLRSTLETAESLEGPKSKIRDALMFYTCQQFYQRMKSK
ncbi:hypothetical protein HYT57_03785 [Candidatus Woesearchaeota archaeon]|nr:hypothetical protein [Candidatus Woesearchaeota archaeon]